MMRWPWVRRRPVEEQLAACAEDLRAERLSGEVIAARWRASRNVYITAAHATAAHIILEQAGLRPGDAVWVHRARDIVAAHGGVLLVGRNGSAEVIAEARRRQMLVLRYPT
jgi:hypothetical protein